MGHTHATAYVWRFKDNFMELIFSFHIYAVLRIELRESSLLGRHLYPLSLIVSPPIYFFRQDHSLNLELSDLARLATRQALGILLSLPPRC